MDGGLHFHQFARCLAEPDGMFRVEALQTVTVTLVEILMTLGENRPNPTASLPPRRTGACRDLDDMFSTGWHKV